MTHPGDPLLNDYVDDELDAPDSAAVEDHLAGCTACRARVDDLRRLTRRLGSLPREIAPPRDLRPGREVADPAPARGSAGPRLRKADTLRTTVWLRTAAAVVAVLAVGALTWALSVGGDRTGQGTPTPATNPIAVGEAVDDEAPIRAYAEATRTLLATFEARRGELAPETAAAVERSLSAVDAAIRELEAARTRTRDPALSSLLEDRYRTRLELLRAALTLLSKPDRSLS